MPVTINSPFVPQTKRTYHNWSWWKKWHRETYSRRQEEKKEKGQESDKQQPVIFK